MGVKELSMWTRALILSLTTITFSCFAAVDPIFKCIETTIRARVSEGGPAEILFVAVAQIRLQRWLNRFDRLSGRSLFYETATKESRCYLRDVLAHLLPFKDPTLATAMVIPVVREGQGPTEFLEMAQWASVHCGVPMMDLTYSQLKETAENYTVGQAEDVQDPTSPRAAQYKEARDSYFREYATYHF
jgi:hypothetical protein